MSKQGQGWYKSIPRLGSMPTLPLLPKSGGVYKVLVQPRLPEQWPVAKINFVGSFGWCTGVTRQLTPPFAVIYEIQFELENGDSLFWNFLENEIELITPGHGVVEV